MKRRTSCEVKEIWWISVPQDFRQKVFSFLPPCLLSRRYKEMLKKLNALLLGRNLLCRSSLPVHGCKVYLETIKLTLIAVTDSCNSRRPPSPCVLLKKITYTSTAQDYQTPTVSKLSITRFLVLHRQYQNTLWYFLSEWAQQPFPSSENKC